MKLIQCGICEINMAQGYSEPHPKYGELCDGCQAECCTKCGEYAAGGLEDGICPDCADPEVDMETEPLNLCECGREPIEHDGLCIKCLNAATREAEQYEQQVKDDYYNGLKGV
jgi:hypothetical protein